MTTLGATSCCARRVLQFLAGSLFLLGCDPPMTPPPIEWDPPALWVVVPDMASAYDRWSWGQGRNPVDEALYPAGPVFLAALSSVEEPPRPGEDWPQYPAPDERARIIAALGSGLSVVRLDTSEVVRGEVREGVYDVYGSRIAEPAELIPLSFVPAAPLPSGWYGFRVDTSSVDALGFVTRFETAPQDGGLAYARVRWGSAPCWIATVLSAANGRQTFVLEISENVDGAGMLVSVAYDGVDVECEQRFTQRQLSLVCPGVPPGATVTLSPTRFPVTMPDDSTPGPVTISPRQVEEANATRAPIPTRPGFGLAAIRSAR